MPNKTRLLRTRQRGPRLTDQLLEMFKLILAVLKPIDVTKAEKKLESIRELALKIKPSYHTEPILDLLATVTTSSIHNLSVEDICFFGFKALAPLAKHDARVAGMMDTLVRSHPATTPLCVHTLRTQPLTRKGVCEKVIVVSSEEEWNRMVAYLKNAHTSSFTKSLNGK